MDKVQISAAVGGIGIPSSACHTACGFHPYSIKKGTNMDNDRIKGAGKEVKGTIKEAVGKVTGNRATETEGKVDKAVGKVQRKIGEAKDDIRNARDKT